MTLEIKTKHKHKLINSQDREEAARFKLLWRGWSKFGEKKNVGIKFCVAAKDQRKKRNSVKICGNGKIKKNEQWV